MMNYYKLLTLIILTLFSLSFTACGDTSTPIERPTIVLEGPTDINISLGTKSILTKGDKFSAYDPQDGDISNRVQRTHNIDFSKEGVYKITYTVTDNDGFSDTKYRTVTISKTDYLPYYGNDTGIIGSAPTINFTDGNPLYLNRGEHYDRYTYFAYDFEDGDITRNVQIGGDVVNTNVIGSYEVYYDVTDSDGNSVTTSRIVYVGNYNNGTTYVNQTDVDLFKSWYAQTCHQQFNDDLYNSATGQYDGTIDCANSNLNSVDLTSLSIFTTIRSLNLSHNNLNYIDFNQLDLRVNNVKVLEDLDLSYNNFSSIDFTPLHNLRNINRLWIQGNSKLAPKYNTKVKREALYRIFNNRSLTIYFDQY